MSKVQRGVVKPPNNENRGPKGNRINSSGPMGHEAPAAKPPNATIHNGDTNNSFMPLAKRPGTVQGSNPGNKFNVDNARDGYDDPPVMAPGTGAVPVNPFNEAGNPNKIGVPLRDTAKRGK